MKTPFSLKNLGHVTCVCCVYMVEGCVCVCTHAYVYMQRHVEARVGIRCYSHDAGCLLKQGLSVAWNSPTRMGWLTGEPQRPTRLYLPSAGVTTQTNMPGFTLYMLFISRSMWCMYVHMRTQRTTYHCSHFVTKLPSWASLVLSEALSHVAQASLVHSM